MSARPETDRHRAPAAHQAAPGRRRTTPQQVAGKLPASYQGPSAAPPEGRSYPQNKKRGGGCSYKKRARSSARHHRRRAGGPPRPCQKRAQTERARPRNRAPAGARRRRTLANTPGGGGSTPHPGGQKTSRRYAGTPTSPGPWLPQRRHVSLAWLPSHDPRRSGGYRRRRGYNRGYHPGPGSSAPVLPLCLGPFPQKLPH